MAMTLFSFFSVGVYSVEANDPDLVYCPLTKKYQPRSTPVAAPRSELDEICVTEKTRSHFVADLLLAGKLANIDDQAELTKVFFQYAKFGKAAIDSIESPRNRRDNSPDQLYANRHDAIGSRAEKRIVAFYVNESFVAPETAIILAENSISSYLRRPISLSDKKYDNTRPRSPPAIS